MTPPRRARPKRPRASFGVADYLSSEGPGRRVMTYRKGQVIFAQGDPGHEVGYVQKGGVKLSVLSHLGKEAVVAILGRGDFFGEGVLAGQSFRIGTATAISACSVLIVEQQTMARLLREEPAFSARFITHMLGRNIRIEADLVDQLFHSSEKRLARTLLLLARYGPGDLNRELPEISQQTLAEMIGTTRSRVNFFMNKFRKLGLIEYSGGAGGVKVNNSLLGVVLHD